jgi:hypothetical protein
MTVEITTSGSTLTIRSPYNAEFVTAAKCLGGKWRDGAWHLDARDEARARTLCREIYGTDGASVADVVTLRVEWRQSDSQHTDPISLHGRTIARATGRDSGARLGDGVAMLSGRFGSGGSMKNWRTTVAAGTIVLVRDFPRAAAEALLAAQAEETRVVGVDGWEGPVIVYEIEAESAPVDRDALRAERERLVARLAEIDAILATEAVS